MLYVFSILPTPEDFIKQLNSIIYNFLWKGPDKIARLATINDLKHGGLDLIDIETSIKASRLAWIGRLFSEGSLPWKAYINQLLEDFEGKFLFRCNYDVKDYKTYSKFYNELLQWWADFRASFSTKPPVSESIIWNNKNIKIDGKPIYYPNYVKAGILFCHHLQFDKDNLQSYNNAIGVGLRNTNFLVWTGVRSAIPAHLKALYSIEKESGVLEFFCGEKIFNPVTSKSKQFYHLLVSEKAKPSRGFKKLKEDFDRDDSSVANAFLNIKSLSSETFIRSFQFKILGDITFTNYRLAKIGYVPNDLCTFCEAGSETVHHLFYECSFSNLFWKHFENFWYTLSGQREDFTLKDVLVGRLDEECDLLNYLFILAKLDIWTCRKHSVTPNFRVFIGMVDVKYRTEMYIAAKNNRRGKFQAKWQLYISARELVG